MRPYKEGEVDFFAIYFPLAAGIYVLPVEVASAAGCLRVDPVLNGQQKLLRWATDYTLDKHIEFLREAQTRSALG
jgi:hypothetical protein